MRYLKKSFAVLLALCLAFSMAVTGFAVELTYSLNSDTLTISGEGDMDDYGFMGAPWAEYMMSGVTAIVVNEGVTHIGTYAFAAGWGVETVLIAGSVTSVGANAFYECGESKGCTITFCGNAPAFDAGAFSNTSNVTVYYPAYDYTWDGVAGQSYGGTNISWEESEHSEHIWTVSWTWAPDFSYAIATRVCSVCDESESKLAVVTQTTNEDGETVYTAEVFFDDGMTATDQKTLSGNGSQPGDQTDSGITLNISADVEEARPGDTIWVSYTLAGPVENLRGFSFEISTPDGLSFEEMKYMNGDTQGAASLLADILYPDGSTNSFDGTKVSVTGYSSYSSESDVYLLSAKFIVTENAKNGTASFGLEDGYRFSADGGSNVIIGKDSVSIVVVDTTELNTAIKKADGLLALESLYTESSLDVLREARDYAQEILDNIDLYYQEDVDSATEALNAACDALVSKSLEELREELAQKIEEAKELTRDDFDSDEAWEALQDAIDAAEEILNDENATEDEVESALAVLIQAMDEAVSGDQDDEKEGNGDDGLTGGTGTGGTGTGSSGTTGTSTGGTATTSPQTGSGLTLLMIAFGFVLAGCVALIICRNRLSGKEK